MSLTNLQVRSGALSCVDALLVSPNLEAGAELANESTAATVGYLASLLLRIVDEEAKAGQQGSRALRAASLRCLRHLINVVADGEGYATLAFLVPGLVSGLCRALVAAGVCSLSSPLQDQTR